ncbi:PI4KG3, partial [Symbiodinium sp. KB8]
MPHELRVHIFTSDRRDGEALHVLNLSVANFTRISAIKALLEQRLGVPVGQQVLQYQRRELHNDEALDDSIPQGARIDFSLRMPDLEASGQWGIVSLRSQCPFPPELEEVLVQVALGQDSGRRPELAGNGTGGAYFLSTVDGRRVACFKPQDEEPYAPNNPRGNVAAMGTYSPIQPGIMSGEGCVREVAAYLMDHEGRAGVPPTGLVEAWSRSYSVVAPAPGSGGYRPPPRKLGSFQVVQNIAALDIRIMNTDRNYENLLQVREAGDGNMWTLIPIDHGYCMPSAMQFMEKEWAKAPAMREPVHADLRAYIARLDVEADITMLRRTLHIREQCLELVRMGSLLLQQGVAAGMTLNDISGWLPGLNT